MEEELEEMVRTRARGKQRRIAQKREKGLGEIISLSLVFVV